MIILLISFLAGVLTILAPCVLPVLPVILGSSLGGKKRGLFEVITGLGVSILLFSLLIKGVTTYFEVETQTLELISGSLIIVFGFTLLLPRLWSNLIQPLTNKSDEMLQQTSSSTSSVKNYLVGAALGPVFNSCSPTYAILLSITIPQNFWFGFTSIIFYVLGLSVMLLLLGLAGQQLTKKIRWIVNPNGWFKKFLGGIMIVLGFLIITGIIKEIEADLLSSGSFDWLIELEAALIKDQEL